VPRLLKYSIALFLVLLFTRGYSADIPFSRWMALQSDNREQVKAIIRSEVDRRDGYSTAEESKANLKDIETEKDKAEIEYKAAINTAKKEFIRAKKNRDEITTQYQAAFTELEELQKNLKTIRTGIENLNNQIARYSQDIETQQQSLKKWLQTEKQGEAIVATIFTRGFKDKAHELEGLADRASAPVMAQHMGTYIQSFTKTANAAVIEDFIRAIEEGTAKWNNDEPLRIELEKGNKGTTYLRLKRYELYPFQSPKLEGAKTGTAKNIKVGVITTKGGLDDFLAGNGYAPANYDLTRSYAMIREAGQINAASTEGQQEQIRLFQERITSIKKKLSASQSEKDIQLSILKTKEEPQNQLTLDLAGIQSKKENLEQIFQERQKELHKIRRVRESIIIKNALAIAQGSQTPAEASADAIIDKLAEVKNDAKTQHSSSTTEVTNYQITKESSTQAITEARITALRLISFINEGESVRVKMAFRVRTVLAESEDEAPKEKPLPPTPEGNQPESSKPENLKDPSKWPFFSSLKGPQAQDIQIEIVKIRSSGKDVSVFVDINNRATDTPYNIALYDQNFRWQKSKLTDSSGREHEVAQVFFLDGQKKISMRDAGTRGLQVAPRKTLKAQLVFAKSPSIKKLVLTPFVYWRVAFVWKWQNPNLVFENLPVPRK